jgi:hypothetical protein
MTLEMWTYIGITSIVLFLLLVVIMIIRGDLKDRLYHKMHKDELIKITKDPNSINSLYFTSGEASRYIKKYVICKTNSDLYVLCNYAKEYKKILFFVVCYSSKGKVKGILRYTERDTTKTSRIIAIPKNTKSVNIVIGRVDDRIINKHITKPLVAKKAIMHSVLFSLATFFALIAFDYLFITILGGQYYSKIYLNSDMNLIYILISIGLTIITFVLHLVSLLSKSKKQLSGGALEYEFI